MSLLPPYIRYILTVHKTHSVLVPVMLARRPRPACVRLDRHPNHMYLVSPNSIFKSCAGDIQTNNSKDGCSNNKNRLVAHFATTANTLLASHRETSLVVFIF